MWSLLRESILVLAMRWCDVIKNFWLVTILLLISTAMVFLLVRFLYPISEHALSFVPLLSCLLLLVIVVWGCGVAPAAVRWHRAVVSGEEINWIPAIPSRQAWSYALRLFVFGLGFVAIRKISGSVWNDIIVPLVFLYENGSQRGVLAWTLFATDIKPMWFGNILLSARAAIGQIIVSAIYLFLLGRLLLSLPEKSLDVVFQGARKSWTQHGYRKFFGAMLLIYSVAKIFEFVNRYLAIYLINSDGLESTGLWIIAVFVEGLSTVLALTLLSVAYRRNLANHRQMTMKQQTRGPHPIASASG
jgi:hypothetical protein